VKEARVAFGGMAAIPTRAAAAEAALVGSAFDAPSIEGAAAALADDFTPLTDMRASAAYRLKAAQNLLRRFHLENSAGAKPATRVLEVAG
jgi:xanthine dehydrogenase small subunit